MEEFLVNKKAVLSYCYYYYYTHHHKLAQIQCVGSQYYAVARDGRIHNTEMHVRSQFIPEGVDTVRIGDLRPNYNYTCVIQETLPEGAPNYNGILSKPVNFTTDYAGIILL